MIAIIFIMGIKYNCNLSNKRPNMIAIAIPNRTIYDCNLFQKRSNMIAIIENLFQRDSSRNHNDVTLEQFSTLQSYLVLFVGKIAITPGPHDENYCNYMWSIPIFWSILPYSSLTRRVFGGKVKC